MASKSKTSNPGARATKSKVSERTSGDKPERKRDPRLLAAVKAATIRMHEVQNQRRPKRPDFSHKRSPEIEEIFLSGLRNGWSVTKSAWAAGIHESSARHWKNHSLATRVENPDGTISYTDDFCLRWEEAYEAGVDLLEDEVMRRAVEGVERPVYQGGLLVGTTTEYSDQLAQFALKGKRPQRYNIERHELTGKDGGPIETSMTIEFIGAKRT